MNLSLNISRRELTTIALGWFATVAVGLLVWAHVRAPDHSDPAVRHGWSAEAFESDETAQIVGTMPAFQIVGENGEQIV